MNTREAIIDRIYTLCKERSITPNALANLAGLPQSTLKSILNGESCNPGVITIKILCDAFEITLAEFFNTKSFNGLEQEIK